MGSEDSVKTALGAVAVGALALALPAPGAADRPVHKSPCHAHRTCPADHHDYVWRGLVCTSVKSERQTRDRIRVRYGGRTYWCHRKAKPKPPFPPPPPPRPPPPPPPPPAPGTTRSDPLPIGTTANVGGGWQA